MVFQGTQKKIQVPPQKRPPRRDVRLTIRLSAHPLPLVALCPGGLWDRSQVASQCGESLGSHSYGRGEVVEIEFAGRLSYRIVGIVG